MSKGRLYTYKKIFLGALVVLIGLLVLFWVITAILERNLNQFIDKIDGYEITVTDLQIRPLTRAIYFKGVEVERSDAQTFHLYIDEIDIVHFSLFELCFSNTIEMEKLLVRGPVLKGLPNHSGTIAKNANKNQRLIIHELDIGNGSCSFQSKIEKDSLRFELKRTVITDITWSPTEKLDWSKWNLKQLDVEQLYIPLNDFEQLYTERIWLDENVLSGEKLKIKTKFDKNQLSRLITVERDHIDFVVHRFKLNNLALERTAEKYEVRVGHGVFEDFDLHVYRDKTVADDLRRKPFYGEMLRNLPFDFNIQELAMDNGSVSYTEKVDEEIRSEDIIFNELNLNILNLNNGNNGEIRTQVRSNIMDEGALEFSYTFNPSDLHEAFLLKGSIVNFDASAVNPFLRTSLQSKTKGQIEQMYFTIDGHQNKASTELKVAYEDFEFTVLKKDLLRINKVLTFLGNLVVNDGSNSDADGYRYGYAQTEPESSKSFLNYLWSCLKEGILDAITGSGKKKT
ncbi:DUF748 domain-containing protein [Flagellimonas sp. 389]|uniref:DUF748 domain-containing protein n=1 Tax=Flagellimonas sp. 389 TaxID=2835862 RepID=UPI001BD2102F|nr:DUF748 domain-containing protein [Flagellimonas sp. 389]MBS9464290.1 DUF748 domain-containing protein [Flagellimonas sp. 389]